MIPTFQVVLLAVCLPVILAAATLGPGADRRQLARSSWYAVLQRSARAGAGPRAAAVSGLALLTLAAPTLYELTPQTRVAVGALVLLLLPGVAVVLFLGLRDPLTELVIAVAISMSVLALGSQVLLAIGYWHPETAFRVALLATAPALTWHACSMLGLRPSGQGSHARA